MPYNNQVFLVDLLDENGTVVASSDASHIGTNQQDIYFDNALTSNFGKTFAHNIVFDNGKLSAPTFNVTTRLFSTTFEPTRRLIPLNAVLLIHFNSISQLTKLLRGDSDSNISPHGFLQSYKTTEAYIVNSNHVLITPTRYIASVPNVNLPLTAPVEKCFNNKQVSDKNVLGMYPNYRGTQVLGASMCIESDGVVLIEEMGQTEAFSLFNSLVQKTFIASLILFAGLLVIIFLVSQHLYNRFNKIVSAARRMSRGDLDIKIITEGNDEIHDLAETFNKLATAIKESQTILENKVRERTSELETAQKISRTGSWVLDMEVNSLVLSNEMFEIFDIPDGTPPLYSYENFLSIIHPDDKEYANNQWTNAMQNGGSYSIEYRIVSGHNTKWIEAKSEFTLDEHGKLKKGTGSVQDITERKLAEMTLVKFKTAIESSGEAIFMTDTKGIITFINPEFTKLYGYSIEEVVGKMTPRILKSGQRTQEQYQTFWKTILGGDIARTELVNKTKDGHMLNIDEVVNPIIEKSGKMIGFLATHRDITEHKKIEQKIIDEKAIDEAILESVGEGVYGTNLEGETIFVNSAMLRILGYTREELLGKKSHAIMHHTKNDDTHFPTIECPIYATYRNGTTHRIADDIFWKKDGTKLPVSYISTPMVENDKIRGAVVVFHDITEGKKVEKMRQDLLSLASHQLRTPLSGTKWLIETLKKGIHGVMNKEQEEYLDEIYKINDRMIGLVSDMLTALRIDSDTNSYKKEILSTSVLFENVSLTTQPAAHARQIILHFTDKESISFSTGPEFLRNILECLVSNAITYSLPQNEVFIDFTQDDGAITFSVKDYGIGIPSDEQKQIFNRFYRATNAKTFNTKNTGLGLYIASTLAEKIGANIYFESEEGVGSTFYVRIPNLVQK